MANPDKRWPENVPGEFFVVSGDHLWWSRVQARLSASFSSPSGPAPSLVKSSRWTAGAV